jgi:hypothetical protein
MLAIVMAVIVIVVVELTIEQRGLMQCMRHEQFALFCNSILHMVTLV